MLGRLAFFLLIAGTLVAVPARAAAPNAPPKAVAGQNESVHVGGTVTLDGSASFDPNGAALTYAWSLTKPAGSAARIVEPGRAITSFVADVPGSYRAVLTVRNRRMGSAAYVTITALSSRSELILNLVYAMDLINYTDQTSFREPAQQKALTGQINIALEKIDQKAYPDALARLRRLAVRMDGCDGEEAGYADSNDWLDCEAQAEVFPWIEVVIESLEDQHH